MRNIGAKYNFEIMPLMDTFHEDDVMNEFESDEDQLEYLASLMSDGEEANDETQCNTKGIEQQKSRTESQVFDKELDEVAKSRKRKLSVESRKHINKKTKGQVDDKTASLQAELEEMKKKMMRMEQLLKEKESTQPSVQPTHKGTKNKRDANGRRLAHQPQCNNNASSSMLNTSLKDNKNTIGYKSARPSQKQQHDTAKQILASDKSTTEKECVTEVYSGLRIRNPLVSSQTMKERMANRKMIRIPMVCSHVKDGDIAGEWVTIGVVVSKLPPKDTAKGGRYCMLRISDLSSQSAVLALFLFDNACKVHWKLQTGDVIAVLSPSLRPDDRAESGGKYTLSLSNADKLMRMGSSHDFTTCNGIVKSTGKKCTNFAKKSEGGCCDYHISQEYRSRMASRMELQSGYGPTVSGMERLKKKMKHDNAFYGGDFLRASDNPESIPKKKVKNRLFAPGAKEAAANMSEELQKGRQSNKPTAEESAVFKEMLKLQSSGARNFNHYRTKDMPKLLDNKPPDLSTMDFIKAEQNSDGSSSGVRLPAVTPFLGRGLLPGTEVDLTSSLKPNMSTAKLKAIAVVEQNPIEREDPNAIKKQNTSDKVKELIAERAKGSTEQKENEQDSNGRKRMDSDEIERIMNKKSSHSWEINEEEWAREEFYFQQLEIKEAMQEKMQKIEKLSVKVVTCKECGYTAEHASDRCRKEGHKLLHKKAEKRFFNCSSCKTRIIAYDRYPKQACSKCGSNNFMKAGMFKERAGPKLGSENLLLRGEEEKFLTGLR